jgi:hypothetical protein
MRSNPENLTAESGLDFRGYSKNFANQRFAVFRHQLSYLASSFAGANINSLKLNNNKIFFRFQYFF